MLGSGKVCKFAKAFGIVQKSQVAPERDQAPEEALESPQERGQKNLVGFPSSLCRPARLPWRPSRAYSDTMHLALESVKPIAIVFLRGPSSTLKLQMGPHCPVYEYAAMPFW